MAEMVTLVAEAREGSGTQMAKRLRRKGMVPAILYGHKEETISLALPLEAFESAVRHGARVVDLQTPGKVEKALISEIQWDHLGKSILHADFTRVSADERIRVSVPVELRGIAPGVAGGGVLDQPMHSLNIECLAIAVPDSIRVNIGELQIGMAIHAKDLTLPPDVKALGDPEAIVVQVSAPVVAAETAAAPTAEQAEPELIGRKPAEEEEEGA